MDCVCVRVSVHWHGGPCLHDWINVCALKEALAKVCQLHITFTAVTLWGQKACLTMTHYNNAYAASNRPAPLANDAHKFHLCCVRPGNVQSHSSVGKGVTLLVIKTQAARFHLYNRIVVIWCNITGLDSGKETSIAMNLSKLSNRKTKCFLWGVDDGNLVVPFVKGNDTIWGSS